VLTILWLRVVGAVVVDTAAAAGLGVLEMEQAYL
jgi:hypothetical protein